MTYVKSFNARLVVAALALVMSSACDLSFLNAKDGGTENGSGGGGGGSSGSGGGGTGVIGGPDIATGSATSTSSTTVTTPQGASLFVPEGAVPDKADSTSGTVMFSIEADNFASIPALPANMTRITDVYRFGPSSTNFVTNVVASLPLKEALGNRDFALYRIDETTRQLELIGRDYNAATNKMVGQTTHFSLLVGAAGPQVDTAAGCTVLDNSSAAMYHWRNVVVSQVKSLAFPSQDSQAIHAGAMASVNWDGCLSGVCNKVDWYLPQGTYEICVETWAKASQMDLPRCTGHWILPSDLVVSKGWHYPEGCTGHSDPSTISVSSAPGGVKVLPGVCPTRPPPTKSIGTGDLQISLRWHSATAIDLDLYVTDPQGAELSYLTDTVPSGGALDIDNKCSNYTNGQPENEFWGSPPAGQYKIEVDWFGDCGNGLSSIDYEVRVVNKTVVKTYTGTISSSNKGSAKKLIDTITVQ